MKRKNCSIPVEIENWRVKNKQEKVGGVASELAEQASILVGPITFHS